MDSIKMFLLFLYLYTAQVSSRYSYKDCATVCQNISECLSLCLKESLTPIQNDLRLPHCGLTSFNKKINQRIIGVGNAEPNRYPWMVSLQLIYKNSTRFPENKNKKQRNHFCGGSIISSRFILTAAHCL